MRSGGRSWKTSSLKNAGDPGAGSYLLPLEVLELALKVKAEVPTVEFRVHELERNFRERSLFNGCPFLEMDAYGESYYTAVWDEPGFDKKLMNVE